MAPLSVLGTFTFLCRCCLRWFFEDGKAVKLWRFSSAELCAVAPLSVYHPLNVAMVPTVYFTKVFTGYILQFKEQIKL